MEKNNKESLTGIRKRQQINKANRTVFAWIASASLVVGVAAVSSQFLVKQIIFNNKVYSRFSETLTTIDKNIETYDELKKNVGKLVADANLNALKKGENSTALQVVIDALPTEENRTSLATSMQLEVLGTSGVTIKQLSVTQSDSDQVAGGSAGVAVAGTNAIAFDITFSIDGSYEQVKQAVLNMERSIRPITIKSIDMKGSESNFSADITAVTYYQPVASIALKDKSEKP